jgi:hypothetical protein
LSKPVAVRLFVDGRLYAEMPAEKFSALIGDVRPGVKYTAQLCTVGANGLVAFSDPTTVTTQLPEEQSPLPEGSSGAVDR